MTDSLRTHSFLSLLPAVQEPQIVLAALTRLRTEEREAIVARVEMGLSYQEIAEALGKPTPEAARMAVSRALMRLAREMEPSDA